MGWDREEGIFSEDLVIFVGDIAGGGTHEDDRFVLHRISDNGVPSKMAEHSIVSEQLGCGEPRWLAVSHVWILSGTDIRLIGILGEVVLLDGSIRHLATVGVIRGVYSEVPVELASERVFHGKEETFQPLGVEVMGVRVTGVSSVRCFKVTKGRIRKKDDILYIAWRIKSWDGIAEVRPNERIDLSLSFKIKSETCVRLKIYGR